MDHGPGPTSGANLPAAGSDAGPGAGAGDRGICGGAIVAQES